MSSTNEENIHRSEDDLLSFLLCGNSNTGPTMKEFLLAQVEKEFNANREEHSIFYQVRALFLAIEERMCLSADTKDKENWPEAVHLLENLKNITDWEKEDMKTNPLMQYVVETLKMDSTGTQIGPPHQSSNFLRNITDPSNGMQKIINTCQKLPKEWTIVQLCKGPRAETSYSTFKDIHEMDAAIYVTVLRHARSDQYPMPLCVRVGGHDQGELFKNFSSLANRFKTAINVDPKEYKTKEAKQNYWSALTKIDESIFKLLEDMKLFIYPWRFLFYGSMVISESIISTEESKCNKLWMESTFEIVDSFCDKYQWKDRERVLLSLSAIHSGTMTDMEIHGLSSKLTSNGIQQFDCVKLLMKRKSACRERFSLQKTTNYPCILVVDDRLDHFFWEEVNVTQEFCRVNSLMALNRLYLAHKDNIQNGYLKLSINEGGSIINADNNLPQSEKRMVSFLKYWVPHWHSKVGKKPTQAELLGDFLKRPCFVYAGHGSGLQYLNGKHIARQKINSVVFLFGCDSSRAFSCGLYSEMIGPHLYYQAATCPSMVGTLMPALDAHMDTVATEILSRWILPHSKHVLPWNKTDSKIWMKEGIVKPATVLHADKHTSTAIPQYQMGSLCAILSRVHQRLIEHRYYNTVLYVCRGLPAWNCDVQSMH